MNWQSRENLTVMNSSCLFSWPPQTLIKSLLSPGKWKARNGDVVGEYSFVVHAAPHVDVCYEFCQNASLAS